MTLSNAIRVAGLAVVLAAEWLVGSTYVDHGTSWHWLLHSLLGIGLGLSAGAVVSALFARRRSSAMSMLEWGLVGQLVSIAPDLLFALAHRPHAGWMDVFVGHVRIHTAPQPLLVALALFLVGGWGWWCAAFSSRRAALALGSLGITTLALALATARPVPTRLADYRGVPVTAWWCGNPTNSGGQTDLPKSLDGARPRT